MSRIEISPEKNERVGVVNKLFRPVFLYLHLMGNHGLNGFSKSIVLIIYAFYVFCMDICIISFTGVHIYELCTISSYSRKWFLAVSVTILGMVCVVFVNATIYKLRNHSLQKWVESFTAYESMYGLDEETLKFSRKAGFLHKCAQCNSLLILVGGILVVLMWSDISELILIVLLPSWANYLLLATFLFSFIIGLLFMVFTFHTASILFKNEFMKISSGIKDLTSGSDKKQTGKEVGNIEQMFSTMYEQHDLVSTLIDQFNDSVSYLLTLTYFVSLPLACLMLYFILTKVNSSVDKFVVAIVMWSISLPATAFCALGCWLNVMAHQPLDYLFKMSLLDVSERTTKQVIMFTAKLTGTSIGLRVCNRFTITPEATLSVIGTLLTFLVVVVQFVPTGSRSSLDDELISNLTACCNLLK